MQDGEEIIKSEVTEVITKEAALTGELSALEDELRGANPLFQQFLEKQAELRLLQAQSADVWKRVETEMIARNIKTIKGDFGTLSIAERVNFDVDLDLLPSKFIKRVPDTTKINGTYKLEGKPPKGVTLKEPTRYLVKRLKG